jgi:hypothetical protein
VSVRFQQQVDTTLWMEQQHAVFCALQASPWPSLGLISSHFLHVVISTAGSMPTEHQRGGTHTPAAAGFVCVPQLPQTGAPQQHQHIVQQTL